MGNASQYGREGRVSGGMRAHRSLRDLCDQQAGILTWDLVREVQHGHCEVRHGGDHHGADQPQLDHCC
jgi:hypothetical protein